jgi:hypothetical protein
VVLHGTLDSYLRDVQFSALVKLLAFLHVGLGSWVFSFWFPSLITGSVVTFHCNFLIKTTGFLTRKISGNHQAKGNKRRKNPKCVSPRNREACHNVSTDLLQNVSKIRSQSTMTKSRRKTLQEFSVHIRFSCNPNNVLNEFKFQLYEQWW